MYEGRPERDDEFLIRILIRQQKVAEKFIKDFVIRDRKKRPLDTIRNYLSYVDENGKMVYPFESEDYLDE